MLFSLIEKLLLCDDQEKPEIINALKQIYGISFESQITKNPNMFLCDMCLKNKVAYCDQCYHRLRSDLYKLIFYKHNISVIKKFSDPLSNQLTKYILNIDSSRNRYKSLISHYNRIINCMKQTNIEIEHIKQNLNNMEGKKQELFEIISSKHQKQCLPKKQHGKFEIRKDDLVPLCSNISEILDMFKLKLNPKTKKMQIINIYLPYDISGNIPKDLIMTLNNYTSSHIAIATACGYIVKLLTILSQVFNIFIPHTLKYESSESLIDNQRIYSVSGLRLLKIALVNFNYSINLKFNHILTEKKIIKEYNDTMTLISCLSFLKRNLVLIKNIL